jgi:hypothetical protein
MNWGLIIQPAFHGINLWKTRGQQLVAPSPPSWPATPGRELPRSSRIFPTSVAKIASRQRL